MALAPWNILASGKFRTDEEEQRRRETGEKGRELFTAGWERTENEKKVSHALEKVAKEVGASHITAGKFHYTDHKNTLITGNAVAIAYLMQKVPYVFPLVGGRKVEQLHGNLEALDISLSPEHIKYLESIVPFDPGFPTSMIVRSANLSRTYQADASPRRAMGHLLLCFSHIPLISRRSRALNQLGHRINKNLMSLSAVSAKLYNIPYQMELY
jgi:hypothetical protein